MAEAAPLLTPAAAEASSPVPTPAEDPTAPVAFPGESLPTSEATNENGTEPEPVAAEGMRQRKAAEGEESKKPAKRKSMMDQAMEAVLDTPTGKKVHAYLQKALPYARKAAKGVRAAAPYVKQGYAKCMEIKATVEPYHLEQYWNLICGFILIFFGGHFVTTIATVEAVRLCGFERSKKAVMVMYDNFMVAKEASAKDDKVDADNDGIADVEQITDDQLVTRKMLLAFRVVDPEQLSHAVGCIYSAYVAVMATLRLRFARAITLGCNIGNYIAKPVKKKFLPKIEPAIPPEYRKWVPVVIDYLCKSLGVTLAWILVRIINSFNAAARGAHMLVKGIDDLARKNDMDWLADGQLDDIVAWSLAAIGIYWQLTSAFYLPWYLQIPLLPFTIIESLLTGLIGTSE